MSAAHGPSRNQERPAKRAASATRAERAERPVALAAMGLEAEFALVLDGQPVTPEALFGSPTAFVRTPMMHRVGRSYHIPTGGALYFDTGVIEVATPMIEIAPGCAARAGRSLWESIDFLRTELDAWQARDGRTVHLSGFSTHYNVSFDVPPSERGPRRTVERLALLLTHVLPFPVMLLAANRRSTGVGVRPRGHRIEITVDFTPDAALMIATATCIIGIVREVMTWPSFALSSLDAHHVPVVEPFRAEAHSSRKGWVARASSFAENPFQADVNAARWTTRRGTIHSARELARDVIGTFWPSIERFGDVRSLRLIARVLDGRTSSLLERGDRPPSYDAVGHLCAWSNLFPLRSLPRSRYERVLIRAVSGRPLMLGGERYFPTGMRGWSHVVFQRDRDKTRHLFSLDFLLDHLRDWEVGPRRTVRRVRKTLRPRVVDRPTVRIKR